MPTSRSHCRGHWAAVLIWRGRWAEAERELIEMERKLERSAPAVFQECAARLGELRRRQGRFDEAEAFYGRAGGHRLALPGRAAIALERGSPERALDLVERFFRRLRDEDRLVRVPGWLVQARAAGALGLDELADSAVASLRALAGVAGSRGLEATARFAEGYARRREDARAAWAAFEDAADLFESAGAPWEAACARVEAARLALALGRCETARSEAADALAALRELGAEADAKRAAELLEAAREPTPDEAGPPRETEAPPLSARQREVLALVAEGLSNREIGERLFVSELTVKRHVADILTRLEVPTRAAAAALAMQRGWL